VTTTLYGIKTCDTVTKARAWLTGRGITYVFHDFKSQGLDAARLNAWVDALGWETVINRSGQTFRKLADADRSDLDRDKAVRLMLAQPSMIKRPVLEHAGAVSVGFKPELYESRFSIA